MTTSTRPHVYIALDNPYLQCVQCGAWVSGWHNPDLCGCGTFTVNVPCCCGAGMRSVCPSWSPVDGCLCQEIPGRAGHALPPALPPVLAGATR